MSRRRYGRVLIVDDSAVARAVLARMVDASECFVVSRTVANVAAALEFLDQARVDFILLDIQMPGVDGITALPDLIAAGQGAKVVIVSSAATDGASTTVQALALGAADTLFKPATGESTTRFGTSLIEKLQRLSDTGSAASSEPVPDPAYLPLPPVQRVAAIPAVRQPPRPLATGDAYDIVAIGASTGGIHALSQVLRALPATFRLPILVTQHLPTSFMPYFAAQLAVLAGRPCEVAVDRLRIRPGRIIVAPGDAHMVCVSLGDGNAAIRLSKEPSLSGCTPSVDPMLSSLAGVYRDRMLAVVLSGMGRDGADGARAVQEAGGCIVVQDRASSVVWGMPGAASEVADAQLTPDAIGRLTAARQRP